MGGQARWGIVAFSVILAACGGDSGGTTAPPPPPVVTTVEVAVAKSALLPADSTVATATVKDQSGAVMPGKTVTWTSSDPAATVSASGVVIGAGTGSANITAAVDGKSGFAPVSVSRDDRFGYIWANDAASPSYQVNNGYEYLSSGSKATITRAATGEYAVTMTGLGATGAQRTNVQVSAYNTGSAYCKSGGWATTGADLVVQVRCFAQGGAASDARFTLLAVGGTALEGRLGFALANNATATASYVPEQPRSSRTGGISAERLSAGRYRLTFGGMVRLNTDGPEMILATAVGSGSERCWVEGWGFATLNVTVHCATAAGVLTDSQFSVLILEKGRPNAKAAFAWADQPAAATYSPLGLYQFNSTGGTNQVTRTAQGSYSVTFPNLSRTTGSAETILVTAYGTGDRRCRIGSWGIGTTVSIFCYDSGGNLMDSEFDIVTVQ